MREKCLKNYLSMCVVVFILPNHIIKIAAATAHTHSTEKEEEENNGLMHSVQVKSHCKICANQKHFSRLSTIQNELQHEDHVHFRHL